MENPVAPRELRLSPSADAPNNPALPVLVYRGVLGRQASEKERLFQQHFAGSGWRGVWKSGIYDYNHFHPDAHEALGIASGSAKVQVGGEAGKTLDLEAGDLIVLPAGTGHRKISGSENLV